MPGARICVRKSPGKNGTTVQPSSPVARFRWGTDHEPFSPPGSCKCAFVRSEGAHYPAIVQVAKNYDKFRGDALVRFKGAPFLNIRLGFFVSVALSDIIRTQVPANSWAA
ncbi:hypothetical protein TWF102_011880 [Orbilia oligospora]|uniref:Uncharacterized protein n=1 Tax=Orbilia oligospora TaxID=2813651 RepID=A0A7C8IZQ4_ORBOL|nr:hypothetical protein TWF102_011880 [Orbilia oligospora]KAF3100457.1 hypothetical protein TWF103_008188 [Orbilia oligospora]